jgi:hypothetical protein
MVYVTSEASSSKMRFYVPFYVYEIASIKHREERNWADEQKAITALKHVARRAITDGASNDALVQITTKTEGRMVYEGTIAQILKPPA